MDNEQKNAPIIKRLESQGESIGAIINHFRDNYSNRESSLVITKLQEALFWLEEQKKLLK